MRTLAFLAAGASSLAFASAAEAREQIRIVGSSTLFPFTTAVAESFGASSEFSTPVVESTGTGGGMRLFCSGVGEQHPDITNASRRMTETEFADCQENGVTDIAEVMVGFDGIVLANANDAPEFDLTLADIYAALAAELPTADDDCTMVANANDRWSDVDPSLPPIRIEVFGPPPTSGTRDAFVELVMEEGARHYASCLDELRSADRGQFDLLSGTLREDGAWIDAGENDNAIVATLVRTPSALGVFGYSFLDQNGDRIKAASIDGVAATFENIASGDYNISRSLFFYMKRQHVGVIPGLQEFAEAFASDAAWGPDGYLIDRGLIPLPDDARAAQTDAVREGVLLTAEMLAGDHGEADAEGASDEADGADEADETEGAGEEGGETSVEGEDVAAEVSAEASAATSAEASAAASAAAVEDAAVDGEDETEADTEEESAEPTDG